MFELLGKTTEWVKMKRKVCIDAKNKILLCPQREFSAPS